MNKFSRIGIRKQVLYLVLGCSLITLLVASGIAFFGMMRIKSESVQIGVEIGETAAKSSNEAIKEVTLEGLQGLVHERSRRINHVLEDLTWGATLISTEMTRILQNPQDYKPRQVYPPDPANTGKLVAQVIYVSGIDPRAVAEEVGLTGVMQDLLTSIIANDKNIASIYFESASGFTLDVDKDSGTKSAVVESDYRNNPWYKLIVSDNKVILTDVYDDLYNRGLMLTTAAPYYNANGEAAGIVGVDSNVADINEIVTKTKIGDSGYAFVMNTKTGQVLFSPKAYEGTLSIDYDFNLENDPPLFDNEDEQLASTSRKMAAKETGMELVNVDGKSYYLAYTPIEGVDWSLGILIEESEVTVPAELSKEMIETSTYNFVEVLNYSIKLMIIAMIIAFILIIVLVSFAGRKIADKFTKPLLTLSDGVREIANGNFDKKLDIQTGNEIEHLATSFNAMTDELKKYMANLTKVTADKERIATELNVATNIQISMLPHNFDFNRDDFEIYATMNAAKEVGGDFYDFYLLDDNHLVITMADVSGKGVPAALFMSRSKTILKNFATMMTNPDDFAAVMSLANNQLCQDNDEMMFVTVFMGMLDLQSGKFVYVNGGHNPPMVYHKSTDKFEYMQVKENIVLGLMDDMDFEQQEIQLESGDILYLYTDGVTEAMDIDNNQYGEERLSKCLNNVNKNADLPNILQHVRDDLSKHVGEADQSDDITMLAVKFNV